MRHIQKIILLLVVLSFSAGCDDQLYLEPISSIAENNYYKTPEQVETGVIGMYDGLQAIPLREFALTEIRSDNTRTKSSEGSWAEFQEMAVRSTNPAISEYYTACYNAIYRANTVVRYLDVVTDTNDRNQFEAEAKFIRALSHFNLVRAFGGVPIVDKVVTPTEALAFTRASKEDVYDFIVEDLIYAKDNLSARSGIAEGRATSGAASALLAKVYLTIGNYTSAKTLLDALVAGSDYDLVPDYSDVFYSELNKEIIFAIQYLDDSASEGQDFSFEMTAGGQASGLNYLTNNFMAAMDVADVERNAVLQNAASPLEVGKFITSSANVRLCGNDWIVLRFADVLLMHAEAILAGGNSTTNVAAITSYNKVRERAGMSELPTDGSGSLTKQMLLDERRIELAFENNRLYDLIRFGVAEDVLGTYASQEGFPFSANSLILPIPQREINASFGAMTQNPGYN